MRIAVDLSSIFWTCLRVGKDPEGKEVEHEGKKLWVNTAKYAYENVINSITAAMRDTNLTPEALILVEEGLNSKRRRLLIDQTYKANRGDKHEAEYAEFQALRDNVVPLLQGLGAIRCSQEGVEGDDILGFLAENTKEDLVIHTFDNDLMVLHGTNKHGFDVQVRIKGEHGINKYGPFPHKLITTYKALVGDTSDNIKGVKGFGDAKFLDFVAEFGEDGLEQLQGVLESGSLAVLASLEGNKLIRMMLEQEAQLMKCYKLAKIHPEWVDTVNTPLRWYGGMVTSEYGGDERLKRFRQQKRLVTNANLLQAYEFLKQKAAETPWWSFDIETSACEESDEWMEAQGNPNGVDVLGHKLTGFSITFGANHQYTYYVSVDHADTDNIAIDDARIMIEVMCNSGKKLVIQNTMFELIVLANTEDNGKTWQEHWANNGFRGFVPNIADTVFEASYVDENSKLGLKERSKQHLDYEQQTFMETVCKTGPAGSMQGGRVIKLFEEQVGADGDNKVLMETRQYKMRELTAAHVFDYGCDDTICTAGLHNFYVLVMQLEGSAEVHEKVEIDAAYQHVDNYLRGAPFSMETMKAQEKADAATHAEAWAVVRAYLISKGWNGTVPPVYGTDITAKQIKTAYGIVMQLDEADEDEEAEEIAEQPKDPIMSSRVRTPAKFVPLMRAEGVDEMFVQALEQCLKSDEGAAAFTAYVQSKFTGEPKFSISPKQMKDLLYTVMELPIRVRNKPTALMKSKGIREGAPMTNALAIKYALLECTEEQKAVLQALQLMQMVKTRQGLYYEPYSRLLHWKTGRIHSSHRQCATNTRRASAANPNFQQLPKHAKLEGRASMFRACFVPHKKDAVIVSLDFVQQELVLIADESQDPNMLSCYMGDNLRDMHLLTALGIVERKRPELQWSYEDFAAVYADKTHPEYKYAKEMRSKGKTTNFATEYGAMAPKLAQTMLIPEEEAEDYIAAKEAAFPVVVVWKESIVEEAKQTGYATTLLGVRRHLAAAFNSDDRFEASKAERQAVNFRIQGSAAEQTKLAEGRMWKMGLTAKYDAILLGAIHDEVVASVAIADLLPFLKDMHLCMTTKYANMSLPNRSSISFGPDFYRQVEIGEEPTEEAVKFGLAEIQKMLAPESATA